MLGQTVAHYEILDKIGEGGMGVVYRARDTRLERDVALKFLSLDFTGSEKLKKRFIQEAKAASVLDHPNICTIHAIEETDDGRLFIAMGYYPGETVKEKLRQGPLSWHEIVDLAVQIAAGLQAAHERGIIHMDVKPANLMVTPEGTVKILDFGLSRFTSEIDRTRPQGPLMGTVAYMPPECVQGEKTGPESDIWALGVVLYEMATGVRPFHGKNDMAVLYSIVHRDVEPAIELRPELPVDLDKVLRRALVKDRRYRYQSAEEVLADLERLAQASQNVTDTLPWISLQDWQRQKLLQRVTGVVAVLAVTLLVVFFLGTGADTPGTGDDNRPPADAENLLFLDLQNLSTLPDTDWLGAAFAQLLVFELPETAELRWLASDALASVDGSSAGLDFEASRGFDALARTRIRQTLETTTWALGGRYRLLEEEQGPWLEVELLVQNMETGSVVEQPKAAGRPRRLPEISAQLARALAPALGLEARPHGQAAARTEPRRSEAADLLAQARGDLRLMEALPARQRLLEAIRLEPGNALLRLNLAMALSELRYERQAQDAIATALEMSEDLPWRERIRFLAWHREIHRQPNAAAALFRLLRSMEEERLVADNPERVDRDLHLAYVLASARQGGAALEVLDRLQPLMPDDPRVPLIRAEAARGKDRAAQQEAAAGAAKLARRIDAQLVLARALVLEGEARRFKGDLGPAADKVEAAREIYVRKGYKWGEASSSMELGNVQWEEQDLVRARASYERAARIYSEIGSPRRARALLNLAVIHGEHGDLGTAIRINRQVTPVFRENGEKDALVQSLFNLAEAQIAAGDFAASEAVIQDAFQTLETWKNPSFESVGLRHHGELLLHQGKLTQARQKLADGLSKQEQTGDQLSRARTSLSLARVFFYQGQLEEALEIQRQAFDGEGNEVFAAQVRSHMAVTLLSQGRLQEARRLFTEALAIQNSEVNPLPAAQTRLSLAALLIAEQQYREAGTLVRRVLTDLAQSRAVPVLFKARLLLAQILYGQGDRGQAQGEVDLARNLLGDIRSPIYQVPLDVLEARLQAARGEVKPALDRLQGLLATTTTEGLVGLGLEIDLAVGCVLLHYVSAETGRSRLNLVAETARLKGYGLISAQAMDAAGPG